MLVSSIRYENIATNESPEFHYLVPDGDDLVITWDAGPTIDPIASWVASHPNAPTDTFGINGVGWRATTQVGFVAPGGTGTVTVEILKGGSPVGSRIFDLTLGFVDTIVYTDAFPALLDGTGGGAISVRITNNSGVDMEVGDSVGETDGFVFAEEFTSVAIPETEICPDLFVTRSDESQIQEYDSATQVLTATYTTIGPAWNLAFAANEEDFHPAELDTENLIEEFVAGVSSGVWENLGAEIDDGNPVANRWHDGHLFVLGFKGSDLKLYKFDNTATEVASWTVASSGVPGAELCLDIDLDGIAYYTEVGGVNGTDHAHLYAFDTNTGTQKTSPVKITNASPSELDTFGAFRLLLGTGGAVVSRRRYVFGWTDTCLEIYNETGALVGQIPTASGNVPVGASGLPDVTDAVCFGEQSNLVWYGLGDNVSPISTLHQVDLNTLALGPSIDPGLHYGIASCTAEQGAGFVFPSNRGGFFVALY